MSRQQASAATAMGLAAITLQLLADIFAITLVRAIAAGDVAVRGSIAALSVDGSLKAAGQENGGEEGGRDKFAHDPFPLVYVPTVFGRRLCD
jgi:hypothetical protein